MKASSEYSQPEQSLSNSHHFGHHASSQLHQHGHKHAHHRHLFSKNISQSSKHPQVFRLKTIALIISLLIAIFLVIDIALYFYLKSNEPPIINLSFVNGIVKSSINIQSGEEVRTLLGNIMAIRPQFYFQHSNLLIAEVGTNFTLQTVKSKLFRNESQNLLYVFSLYTPTTLKPNLIAIFVPSYFGIPEPNDYNNTIEYFTIDAGTGAAESNRKAFIVSLTSNKSVSMRQQIQKKSLLDCKTYVLSQPSQNFELLSAVSIDFKTKQLQLSSKVDQKSYNCFDSTGSSNQLKAQLFEIFGTDFLEGGVGIDRVEVYYLNNQD